MSSQVYRVRKKASFKRLTIKATINSAHGNDGRDDHANINMDIGKRKAAKHAR
jgi:hypothetical protein